MENRKLDFVGLAFVCLKISVLISLWVFVLGTFWKTLSFHNSFVLVSAIPISIRLVYVRCNFRVLQVFICV